MVLPRIRRKLLSLYYPESWSASRIAKLQSDSGIVLMYHEVLPDNEGPPAWTVVRQSEFRRQMQFLVTNFDIVNLDVGIQRLSGKYGGKKPFAVITFDDGYSGVLNTIHPIMEEMDVPYTVYLATGAIQDQTIYWYDKIINLVCLNEEVCVTAPSDTGDLIFRIPNTKNDKIKWVAVQRLLEYLKTRPPEERYKLTDSICKKFNSQKPLLRMLTAEDVRYLSQSPLVTIGAHTHGHELLDQLADTEIKSTLSQCNNCISSWAGTAARHFAYPNGNFDSRVAKIVQEEGFETAVTTQQGVWDSVANLYEVPRVSVGRFDSLDLFRAKVVGRA